MRKTQLLFLIIIIISCKQDKVSSTLESSNLSLRVSDKNVNYSFFTEPDSLSPIFEQMLLLAEKNLDKSMFILDSMEIFLDSVQEKQGYNRRARKTVLDRMKPLLDRTSIMEFEKDILSNRMLIGLETTLGDGNYVSGAYSFQGLFSPDPQYSCTGYRNSIITIEETFNNIHKKLELNRSIGECSINMDWENEFPGIEYSASASAQTIKGHQLNVYLSFRLPDQFRYFDLDLKELEKLRIRGKDSRLILRDSVSIKL